MSDNHIMTNILKRLLAEATRKNESAGIVILKEAGDDWLFLALVKEDGRYDITKGIREKDEDVFNCAKREAFEEADISETDLYFKWGNISNSYGRGTAFVAITNASPQIKPNPETGLREHIEVKWVPYKEMVENVSNFLVPSIKWAYKVAKS